MRALPLDKVFKTFHICLEKTIKNVVARMGVSNMLRFKSKLAIWLWTFIWLLIVLALFVYWKDLPTYISWPLAIFEALVVPDIRMMKATFKEESSKISK